MKTFRKNLSILIFIILAISVTLSPFAEIVQAEGGSLVTFDSSVVNNSKTLHSTRPDIPSFVQELKVAQTEAKLIQENIYEQIKTLSYQHKQENITVPSLTCPDCEDLRLALIATKNALAQAEAELAQAKMRLQITHNLQMATALRVLLLSVAVALACWLFSAFACKIAVRAWLNALLTLINLSLLKIRHLGDVADAKALRDQLLDRYYARGAEYEACLARDEVKCGGSCHSRDVCPYCCENSGVCGCQSSPCIEDNAIWLPIFMN